MAGGRPIEESLTFFPHDTNARGDRKLKIFVRYVGFRGYGFYWNILEEIYNEGYFMEWDDEYQELMVAEFHSSHDPIEYEDVSYLLEKSFKAKLLNRRLFDEYGILTSASIQRRWLKASSRRVLAKMRKEYVLINLPEFYEKELKSATISIKILDKNGNTDVIYGDYEEDDNGNGVSVDTNEEDVDNSEPEYDEKYDFHCDYRWDGQQPIDFKSCIEDWNKITGGQAWTKNIPKSKKKDLARVFRNYMGTDVYYGLIARSRNETLRNSKYMTDWSTVFGAKKLENLDKWVDRGREWIQKQSSIETAEEHLDNGWMTQKDYYDLCEKQGIDPDEPMWCSTKQVESQLLYYPEFSY